MQCGRKEPNRFELECKIYPKARLHYGRERKRMVQIASEQIRQKLDPIVQITRLRSF